MAIDFLTAWIGTREYVFAHSESDPAQSGALLIITFLILAATLLLSRLLLTKDLRGKPFLF